MLVYLTDRFYNPKDEGRIALQRSRHQLRLGNAAQISPQT